MTDYDDATQESVARIRALLTENIDQAREEGADADAVADLLLETRDTLVCEGYLGFFDPANGVSNE